MTETTNRNLRDRWGNMGITNFGIFRTKQLTPDDYHAIAGKVADALSQAQAQLNKDLVAQKNQSVQLQNAFVELTQIQRDLRSGLNGPSQAADPLFDNANLFDNLTASNQVQPNVRVLAKQSGEHAKQTAVFFEQQLQRVVNVYNQMMTLSAVSTKDNQTIAGKIGNSFLDFFTKIADLFRRLSGHRLQANWTHSPAQSAVKQQFQGVFNWAENAKNVVASKGFDKEQGLQQFRPSYQGF